MNFDHVNKVSDYTRDQLMPHFCSRMSITDFGNYLAKVSESASCKWMRSEMRAFPVHYFVDPAAFAKKYAKKCIAFIGTTNPQDGAINVIYQLSPTMHVLARLYHWVEHEKVRAYFMLTCAYRDQAEYLAFFDDNKTLRLTGNTEERQAGFGAGVSSNSAGIEELLKGLTPKKPRNEEDEEVEETP